MNAKKTKTLKIGLIASAGGHLTQLLKLSDCWQVYQTFSITTTAVVSKALEKTGPVYTVGESNFKHPFKVFCVLMRCIPIIWKEKPDVIISTGAAHGCLCCYLAKLLGAKIIWIDSITNVSKMSLSGRLVNKIADLQFVQWPDLEKRYSKTHFAGSLI